MRLIYENEKGKIVMHGGDGAVFNIIEIKGLSFPDTETDSVYYPNIAGRNTSSVTPLERFITVSADAKDKTGNEIARAMNILSSDGTITITSGNRKVKISARCESFEPNKRRGIYVPFTAQFVADNPYFTDTSETRLSVNKKEKKLKTQFVLPCVVSQRKTESAIVNRGHTSLEPLIEITSVSGAACPDGIIIKNPQSGKTIKLNTDVLAGEVICMDVENRKITSSMRGNILKCIDDETSISDFAYEPGVGTLMIYADNLIGTISATARFYNRYLCAGV